MRIKSEDRATEPTGVDSSGLSLLSEAAVAHLKTSASSSSRFLFFIFHFSFFIFFCVSFSSSFDKNAEIPVVQ